MKYDSKNTKCVKSNSKKIVTKDNALLQQIKRYRDRNLGVLFYNGKYYDTNFINKPVEITRNEIKELRREYDVDGKRRDIEIADMFVRHMRRKYGTFDKNGNFLGMLGDDE